MARPRLPQDKKLVAVKVMLPPDIINKLAETSSSSISESVRICVIQTLKQQKGEPNGLSKL